MATVGGLFQSDGLPRNGATAKLWTSGAVGSPPAKNTAIPVTSPLQSATTGTAHGGDGAWRFTGVSPGLYYVSIEWNGAVLWDTVNVQSDAYTTVKTYGAVGDGVTDDTAAIQAALNDAATGELVFPPGTYVCGNVTINSRQRLRLIGAGGYVKWNGAGSAGDQIGFQLTGTNLDISFEGMYLLGDNAAGNLHAGIWSKTSANITNLKVMNCRFENMVRGVKLAAVNANGGQLRDILIEGCYFINIIGTAAGAGEGVFIDEDTVGLMNVRVLGNHFSNCAKYDIHLSKGRDVLIADNQSDSHRASVSSGAQIPCIRVTNARDVRINGNTFKEPRDGCIEVVPQSGTTVRNISIEHNTFSDPVNGVADIVIGTAAPSSDGAPDTIKVCGNQHYRTSINANVILVSSGKRVKIEDNQIVMLNVSSGTRAAISLAGSGESAGTANYNDSIQVTDNQVYGTTSGGGAIVAVELQSAICTSAAKMRLLHNFIDGGNDYVCGTGVTDPNLIFVGGVLGFAGSGTVAYQTLNVATLSAGRPFVVKTNADSPYTALGTDEIIIGNTAGGAITVNLPTAVGRAGKHYSIGRQGANSVTVDPAGAETIGGAATYTLGADNACVQCISDGANWRVFGSGV